MCVQGTAALLRKLDEEGTQEAFNELVDYMREQVRLLSDNLHALWLASPLHVVRLPALLNAWWTQSNLPRQLMCPPPRPCGGSDCLS